MLRAKTLLVVVLLVGIQQDWTPGDFNSSLLCDIVLRIQKGTDSARLGRWGGRLLRGNPFKAE